MLLTNYYSFGYGWLVTSYWLWLIGYDQCWEGR